MSACKVGTLHVFLPAADQQLLTGWLTNGQDTRGRRVSAEAMADALRADGHAVGPTTLKDHRAGRCACQNGR